METNTLDNQSRSERFERIKAECRLQEKKGLWAWAFALFLFLIIAVVVVLGKVRIIYICMILPFGVSFVWSAVNYYWFLQRLDSLDTPEQLLHSFHKRLSNQRNASYLQMLGLVGLFMSPIPDIYSDGEWLWLILPITILAFLIYSYFKGDYVQYKTSRDEEILSRLEDLVEKK